MSKGNPRVRYVQAYKRFVCDSESAHEVFVSREYAEGRTYAPCADCGGVLRKRSYDWRPKSDLLSSAVS